MRLDTNVMKAQAGPELAFFIGPHQGAESISTGSAFENYVPSLSAINPNSIFLHFLVLSFVNWLLNLSAVSSYPFL